MGLTRMSVANEVICVQVFSQPLRGIATSIAASPCAVPRTVLTYTLFCTCFFGKLRYTASVPTVHVFNELRVRLIQ